MTAPVDRDDAGDAAAGGLLYWSLDQDGPPRGDTRPTSPSSINLTTAMSGRRLAGALVLGPGVASWQTRRLNSLNRYTVNCKKYSWQTRRLNSLNSTESDTIVYFISFDLWGVERHPQGSII